MTTSDKQDVRNVDGGGAGKDASVSTNMNSVAPATVEHAASDESRSQDSVSASHQAKVDDTAVLQDPAVGSQNDDPVKGSGGSEPSGASASKAQEQGNDLDDKAGNRKEDDPPSSTDQSTESVLKTKELKTLDVSSHRPTTHEHPGERRGCPISGGRGRGSLRSRGSFLPEKEKQSTALKTAAENSQFDDAVHDPSKTEHAIQGQSDHIESKPDKSTGPRAQNGSQGPVRRSIKKAVRHTVAQSSASLPASAMLMPDQGDGRPAELVSLAGNDIPRLIFQHILSFLTWQDLLGVKRVSRDWRDVADACLAQRTVLHIKKFDFPAVLEDETLEKLLQVMPALRCLSIEWRPDGRKLDIDVVSQHCRNLTEIDLTRFRLDAWSLEQLCAACPKLEVIKLPQKCDDTCVNVLLHSLSHLRSLDLTGTQVTGNFLKQFHQSLEKISLAGCSQLKFENLGEAHSSPYDASKPAACRKIRDLDLSSTSVTASDLQKILRLFPLLERLSLSRCDKLQSGSLLQVALHTNLRALDISYIGELRASDLVSILVIPRLERLSLAGCNVQGSAYLPFPSLNPLHLRELNIAEVCGLTAVHLSAILSRTPHLERLFAANLDKMDLTATFTQLGKCAQLLELDVSRTGSLPSAVGMSVEGSQTRPNKKKREHGACARTPSIKSEPKHAAAMCPSGGTDTKKESENGVKSSTEQPKQPKPAAGTVPTSRPGIEHHLTGMFTFGSDQPIYGFQEGTEETDTLNDYLSRQLHPVFLSVLFSGCPKLERLLLAGCHLVESASLGQLAWCPSLRELDLSRVTNIGASELATGLSSCHRLERLSIAELEAPVEQIIPPHGLPGLTFLDVSQSGLTSNSLRRLPRLFPRLRSLNLRGCSAVSEDALMSYLPRLRHLHSLDLRDVHNVSEAVLGKLKQCRLTELRLGDVGKKDLSRRGIRRLVLGCKSLKVLWLEAPDDFLKEIVETLDRVMSNQRILVIYRGQTGVERTSVPEPQCKSHNIYIVEGDSVQWQTD